MAKNLTDNFANSKWTGPTVKLTPTDKTGTPEDFEKLYDRRRAPQTKALTPKPTLKPIEHRDMSELLEQAGLEDI